MSKEINIRTIEDLTVEATRVFGHPGKAKFWLNCELHGLEGRTPLDVASEGRDGMKAIGERLALIDHGMHS